MNDVKHELVLFYKIILGYAPQDLRDMVEPCMYFKNNYNLRTSNMTYRIPILRTTSYYNNFLPSTIKAWNELPQDTKDCSSVASFKSKLNKNLSKKNKLFDHGPRRESIIHCQLRNKASNLNAHLSVYEDFLNEDPSCQYCGNSYEGTEHFFSLLSKIYHTKGNIVTAVHNFYYMVVINVT